MLTFRFDNGRSPDYSLFCYFIAENFHANTILLIVHSVFFFVDMNNIKVTITHIILMFFK